VDNRAIENLVRSLTVGHMNALLYFAGHRRVIEACEAAVHALGPLLKERGSFVLGIREGLILAGGKPHYDLSLTANRLIQRIKEIGAGGILFNRGVTAEHIRVLIEILASREVEGMAEANKRIEQVGATGRVAFIQHALDQAGEEALQEEVSVEGEDFPKEDLAAAREVAAKALSALQDVMLELRKERRASFSKISDVAYEISRTIRTNPLLLLIFTAFKRYDAYTFHHVVNVCILTTAVADTLISDMKELVTISEAALLHDIGKILVAEEILQKNGKLTDSEWEVVRQHPLLGAKMLIAAGGVSEVAMNVTYGHHLRYDQSGYPEPSRDLVIDPLTQLVNVIDVYEALTAARPYKEPMPPEKATAYLLEGAGTEFNPLCVEALISYLGVFPVGTNVLLSDGSVGRVTAPNPADPFRPKVRVFQSPDGMPLQPGRLVDTSSRAPDGSYRLSIVRSLPQEKNASELQLT